MVFFTVPQVTVMYNHIPIKVGGHQLAAVFANINFMGSQPGPFVFMLSVADSVL